MRSSAAKRPNILFIMADQWHHLDFGYRKHSVVKTPNLDRLQAESIDFTHTYAQNAFCLPSRACIFTGQYVRTHRQYGFTGLFPEEAPCLPELLQRHGYHTFHVGKYHVNPFGDRLGFDEFVPTLPEDIYQATDPDKTYMAWCRERGLGYPNDQVHGDDYRTVFPPQPVEFNGHRMDVYGTSAVPAGKSIETYTANRAIEFLERHGADRPFYLSLSFDRPHGPWTPSPEDCTLYDPDQIPLPERLTEEDLARMPAHIVKYVRGGHATTESIGEEGMRTILSLYYSLITRVDAEIGRVLDALETTGHGQRTIIVFCTDHGDMAGRLGLFDKYSNKVYRDDIIRTPLLLKIPGHDSAGQQGMRNAELIDLFPTLCGLTDISTTDIPLDGKDLLAPSGIGNTPWAGTAFSESYAIKTVVKDGWKLIHYVNHHEGELYHLTEDPEEHVNRFGDPTCLAKRTELLAELVAFFTPTPSAKRQSYIRSLFDDSEMIRRECMGKLFKWCKGIVEGSGFWESFEDGYRLTAIPFDGIYRLDKLDETDPTDGLVWHYAPIEDGERLERMLRKLVDYLSGKIRPISIMTGGPAERENMLFSRGFGFC